MRLGWDPIPDLPILIGVKLYTAFLVIDPSVRSNLGLISNTVLVEIAP